MPYFLADNERYCPEMRVTQSARAAADEVQRNSERVAAETKIYSDSGLVVGKGGELAKEAKSTKVTKVENRQAKSAIVSENVSQKATIKPETQKEVYVATTFKSGGIVESPTIGKQNKNEVTKNLEFAKILAKDFGYKIRLLAVNQIQNEKNPDALNLINNKYIDFKITQPLTTSGKTSIQNAIREASRQKVSEVYIYFGNEVTMRSVYSGVKCALQNGRAKSIENIFIIFKDKSIKKINVGNYRKVLK